MQLEHYKTLTISILSLPNATEAVMDVRGAETRVDWMDLVVHRFMEEGNFSFNFRSEPV